MCWLFSKKNRERVTTVKENVILKDYIETHGLKENYVAEKWGRHHPTLTRK